MEKVMYLMSDVDIQKIVANVVENLKPDEPVKEREETLFTTKEACEFLRCSKPTLHRWKKEGLIPFVRIGVNIRYRESDLKKIVEKKGA